MAHLSLRLEAYTRFSRDDMTAIRRLAERGTREVPARRDLIREGDRARSVFLVLDGWACRYKTLPDGRRQIVGFFIPGDLCDLKVYLLDRMDHNIGAISPLTVAEIAPDEFDQMMVDYPRITKALHWDELVTVAIQREWTVSLGQRSAYERIAHLLCEMYLRLEVVGRAENGVCEFPLTQVDLADATGLTAVHVNRTLQEMRKDGLIELSKRTLSIPDLGRLKRAGLFNPNYLHLDREGRSSDAND